MLDVHPPEHTPHTWRDFLIHIATIVVGLLIAIGLERAVEMVHRHHQRHTAEQSLDAELSADRTVLADDEKQLQYSYEQLEGMGHSIESREAHGAAAEHVRTVQWEWNALSVGAWNTARNSNALELMPYDQVQYYTDLYTQVQLVNAQSGVYIADVYRIAGPVLLGKTPDELTAADLTAMHANVERAATDVKYLLDLCRGLDSMYAGH
jgi:hypothetical protein